MGVAGQIAREAADAAISAVRIWKGLGVEREHGQEGLKF
jgi:hypothetical protein